jgi:hypothetical protein
VVPLWSGARADCWNGIIDALRLAQPVWNASERDEIAMAEEFLYFVDYGRDQSEEFAVANKKAFAFFLPSAHGFALSKEVRTIVFARPCIETADEIVFWQRNSLRMRFGVPDVDRASRLGYCGYCGNTHTLTIRLLLSDVNRQITDQHFRGQQKSPNTGCFLQSD